MSAGRTVRAVSDMELDEVSLVDRPANPHASIVIAKAYQGEDMETGYFWLDGTPVLEDDEVGPEDQFQDAEGNVYQLSDEAIAQMQADAEEAANEPELAEVGKSAFGRSTERGPVQKSLAEELRESLSKAVGDAGTREVLAKALQAVEVSDQRASQAEQIAKSERDIRLTREYISKAESYGEIPGVTADELGPILKRCEEFLPNEDCVTLNKVFEATGNVLFQELGRAGTGSVDGTDPFKVVEELIATGEGVSKSTTGKTLSKAAQTEAYFAENPEAYDEYMASKASR